MSLRDFNKISIAASRYWENQLKTPQKKEDEQSTNCGCHNISKQSLLEISADKAEEYLFPTEEKIKAVEEPIDIEDRRSSQDDSEMEVSSTIFSESAGKREHRKSRTTSNRKKLKNRFTTQEDHYIMESMRQGSNFNVIAQQIPGSTVSQIKKHFLKKLKVLNRGGGLQGDEVADTIFHIQKLLDDETTENTLKVVELRRLISNIENHLHQTKQLILQKYLSQFQQE